MKSGCESIERHLVDDLDDALSLQDRSCLDDHLAGCPACRDLQEKMKKAHEATSVLRRQREALTMPAGLTVAIKQQLNPRKPVFSRPAWRFASALTMVVLLIAAVWVYQSVIPRSSQSLKPETGSGAAFSDQMAEKSTGREITGDASASSGKSAAISGSQAVPATATTAAATRTYSSDMTFKLPLDTYVLYSGSLAALKPLQDTVSQSGAVTVSRQRLLSALQESLTLSNAVRVLTNPDALIRNVVILAGYSQPQVMVEMDRIRSSLSTDDQSVSLEVIGPENSARLIELFGQSRYDQLMPFASDRKLTYLLIMIGG